MATDYYIVGYLRKDYEEIYSKLGNRWKKFKKRKYDIIDKVQKDGLLLVGINPSFDESFEGMKACPLVHNSLCIFYSQMLIKLYIWQNN